MGAASAGGAVYEIDQSCRFNDNDSAFTAWTPGGVGDSSKIFTIDMWVKRANLGISTDVFTAGLPVNDSNYCHISFDTSDRIIVRNRVAIAFPIDFTTTAVYRDPSAWMHIHLACDTTQASATDGFKLTVNGVRVTSFALSTYTQNSEFWFSKANLHRVGRASNSYSLPYYDGYLSEMRYIDGIQKEPTDFGETNSDGVWVPIEYTGAYGTNGFYLDFANSADFGSDQSGNGNDFTDSGLTTTDQMLDTPTVNYCTLNPLFSHSSCTFSNGNLDVTLPGAGTDYSGATGSFGVTSGKWYWEVTPNNAVQAAVGIFTSSYPANNSAPGNPSASGYLAYMYRTTGTLMTSASWDPGAAYGDTYTTADVIGIALDLDAGTPTIEFFKNNTSQDSLNIVAGTWLPGMIRYDNGPTYTTNFGQSGFTYTPPAGFLALNTSNLPEPTIKDGSAHFQTTLYTGNGTAIGSGGNAISQSGNSTFQPDFAWIKGRSGATEHVLTDAVRGVTKELSSNDTGAEETVAEGLTTFGSAGFTVGSDGSYNTSSATYVGWQWKANGAGSSNTDGSITSTVSVDTTSGFSIVTYSGIRPTTGTVGHGLGVKPDMMIFKNSVSATVWYLWHKNLTNETTYAIYLNTTAAQTNVGPTWNSTAPTSSVFSLGNDSNVNNSTQAHVAYCFNSVEGYSKFGSYPGVSSADGAFISTGFKPAFVMVKNSTGAGNWLIWDSQRGPYNVMGAVLQPNTTSTEAAITAYPIDFLSNGFKHRQNHSHHNTGGYTYIYAAFAENPFGGANTAPATAR